MTQWHQRVVVVVLLVEPVTPDVLPLAPDMLPVADPEEPVPVAPIELVPPVVPLLPVVVSVLPLLPVVELGLVLLEPRPAEPPPVLDGEVVVLDELVEPVAPGPPAPRLHALRERAATTARAATAAWVRDVFIRTPWLGL